MSRGRVLIIADEWVTALLTRFLTEAGYEVTTAASAREGFDKVRELLPDCILCDVVQPDIDGFWVARRVRAEQTKAASTPFVFLTEADDAEARLQGLHVGADLYLSKPFRSEDVVAQVGAMIDMASRLRRKNDSMSGEAQSAPGAAALQGDIAHMSLTTILTLLELERRSGRLRIKTEKDRVATVELYEGSFARASIDDQNRQAIDFLREVLRWKQGSFVFRNSKIEAPRGNRQSINYLLLEAMRLDDETGQQK
ncbi:MAG TPA: response regulator [Polyangiaceae bacterium]|nr:response regulator [Polyangiaceae bacterium]